MGDNSFSNWYKLLRTYKIISSYARFKCKLTVLAQAWPMLSLFVLPQIRQKIQKEASSCLKSNLPNLTFTFLPWNSKQKPLSLTWTSWNTIQASCLKILKSPWSRIEDWGSSFEGLSTSIKVVQYYCNSEFILSFTTMHQFRNEL